MDLDELRCFLALLDHGSLAGAALALGEPRTTLRRRLLSLQERVGTPLWTPTADGARPTPAGETLARGGRPLLARYDAMMQHAKALGEG